MGGQVAEREHMIEGTAHRNACTQHDSQVRGPAGRAEVTEHRVRGILKISQGSRSVSSKLLINELNMRATFPKLC